MLAGEVKPTSMMRRPGSPSRRLRTTDQPPECRGTLGPVSPAAGAGEPLAWFFSNQRPSNLKSPCSHTGNCLTDCKPGIPSNSPTALWDLRWLGSALGQVHFSTEYRVVFHRQPQCAN